MLISRDICFCIVIQSRLHNRVIPRLRQPLRTSPHHFAPAHTALLSAPMALLDRPCAGGSAGPHKGDPRGGALSVPRRSLSLRGAPETGWRRVAGGEGSERNLGDSPPEMDAREKSEAFSFSSWHRSAPLSSLILCCDLCIRLAECCNPFPPSPQAHCAAFDDPFAMFTSGRRSDIALRGGEGAAELERAAGEARRFEIISNGNRLPAHAALRPCSECCGHS